MTDLDEFLLTFAVNCTAQNELQKAAQLVLVTTFTWIDYTLVTAFDWIKMGEINQQTQNGHYQFY